MQQEYLLAFYRTKSLLKTLLESEDIAKVEASYTGQYLKEALKG